jgi:hypothetical protein
MYRRIRSVGCGKTGWPVGRPAPLTGNQIRIFCTTIVDAVEQCPCRECAKRAKTPDGLDRPVPVLASVPTLSKFPCHIVYHRCTSACRDGPSAEQGHQHRHIGCHPVCRARRSKFSLAKLIQFEFRTNAAWISRPTTQSLQAVKPRTQLWHAICVAPLASLASWRRQNKF